MEPKTKIMYVDDESLNRQLFSALIKKENFDVFLAIDGAEALELLDNNSDIKLIFSDMQMPLMNGIEFIQKAREKFIDKKYVLVTSMEKTAVIQQALDSKTISKFVMKPINYKILMKVIEEMLKNEALTI